jgi:WD40 repeat protein
LVVAQLNLWGDATMNISDSHASASDETGRPDEPSADAAEEGRPPDGFLYDAFISYSRHNLDAADKIERDLETFPLPREVGKRLGHRRLNVFRDINDMTGNRLEPALERNLEQSRILVVLCSPAARQSTYVAIEISRFAQLRDAAQIVPALVAGGPNNDPAVESAEWAFPDALGDVLGSDPLAVDLRRAWNIKSRRAKLARGSPWVQLVAGIVGATTDDLTERIARAERRRLQSIVAILAVGLAVVSLLGAFAWKQRNEAKHATARVVQVQQLSRLTSDMGAKPQLSLLLGVQAAGLATGGQYETLLAIDGIRQQLRVTGGRPLLGHPQATRAASFSADRRWLATGSDDGTIRLWHMDTTDPAGRSSSLAGHSGPVHGLAFSPDGQWLVSGGADGTVRLWRLTGDGANAGPVLGGARYGAVNAVAISPDGTWLAFGTQNGNLCAWKRSANGFLEAPCEVGKDHDPVMNVTFSANGRWLATTCTGACSAVGAAVVLWDLRTDFPNQEPRRLLQANPLREDSLLAVAFSHNESRLAVAYGYLAEVWDLTRPDPPQHVIASDLRTSWIFAVALSPDNRWLATGTGEAEITLSDLTQPGRLPIVLKGHSAAVRTLSFSDDSRWLASGSDDTTARLWDMADPTFPSTLLRGQDMPVGSVMFRPGENPRNLLAMGTKSGDEPNARLWSIPNLVIDPVVLRGEAPPKRIGMAVNTDGQWVAASSLRGETLELWSTRDDRTPVATLPLPSGSRSIAFSQDGRWLAAKSDGNGAIRLWDMRDLSRPPLELSEDSSGDYNSLSFSPDSRLLVSGTWGGIVNMWDVSKDNPAAAPHNSCRQGDPVRGRPAFSPDGRYLATAATGAAARLWDLKSPNPCAAPRLLGGHQDVVDQVVFSADSRWAATASFDQTGRLWNIQDAGAPKLATVLKFDDRVLQAAFSPDNRWVAFGSWDRTIKLLDLTHPDATKAIRLAGHAGRIYSMAFSPDSRWLATGAADRTIRLWDPALPNVAPVILRGHDGGVIDIGFSNDGRWIVTGGEEGTVRLWRLKLADLVDVACEIAGRDLTADEERLFLGGAAPQHLCSGGHPH